MGEILGPQSYNSQPGLEFPPLLKGKKILLGTESFGNVNGVSRTTGQLVAYLRANGVNVAVVAPASPSHPDSIQDDLNPELRLKGYPLPYNPELSVVYPFRIDRLILRTFQPDLIYLASPASVGFQILLQLRRLTVKPIILCNFQTDLSGYCEILFPWPFSAWAVWVFGGVQGWLFNHSSVRTVFYPSLFVRRYLEKQGVSGKKMENLRRGVDTEMFDPSRRSSDYRRRILGLEDGEVDDKIILVSVSRVAPEKGFDFLSKVAHILYAEKFPFHLLIVGGNQNKSVELEVQALFADIQTHVTFAGFLMGEELATAYASSDIKLHSSVTETFGLVVLEAMASGLPVVARNEGGPSEIVVHNKAGYLVQPDDVDTFVSRVKTLGYNPNLRAEMARAARIEAKEWTWEKINNRVAWQLADAMSYVVPSTSSTLGSESATTSSSTPLLKNEKPLSTLLLRRPLLSGGIVAASTSLAIDAQITAWVAVIVGVWAGLLITFAGVLLIQLVQGRLGPLISWARKWKQSRLVGREMAGAEGRGHGTRRI